MTTYSKPYNDKSTCRTLRKNVVSLACICSLLALIFLIGSCKKFVEVPNPVNEVQTVDVFEDDQTALSALSGLYVQMSATPLQFTYGGLSVFGGLSADDIYNTSANAGYDPFFKNSIPSNEQTTNFNRFWSRAYILIYQTNAMIEGINRSTKLTATLKDQVLGEVKFLRAFYYFHLINLYGNVPLITSTDYRINDKIPRTAITEVSAQIIADLKEAQTLLAAAYPSAGKVRPNKWTATALLARTYLYAGDWANAEIQASSIIGSSSYSIENNLNNVFKIASPETIWQIIPPGNVSTQEAVTFIPSSSTAKPTFAVTSILFNAFEASDARKVNWLATRTIGTPAVTYYYPFKYKTRSGTVTEYNVVFRLAEQYLIRAEARAQQDKITDAQTDLNIVRTRATLPNTTAMDKASLLSAIATERQLEFFAEWGHRWFDLKRTNRADAVLAPQKAPGWQPTDVLYPIPFNEILINPSLTQNDGYQ